MPLLHGSFEHLIANTPPLLLLGTLLAANRNSSPSGHERCRGSALGGVLVWLLGSSAIHIGASGLVFGWFGFLITRGLVDRSPVTLGASVLVGLFYGSIILGRASWSTRRFLGGTPVRRNCRRRLRPFLIRAHVHAPRMRDVDLR